MSTVRMVVCPSCDGTGKGSSGWGVGSRMGMFCGSCRGTGEVTVEKHARLAGVPK